MPLELVTDEPKQIAKTPEFQALQKQIKQATSLLDSISNQIVAIEARMQPEQEQEQEQERQQRPQQPGGIPRPAQPGQGSFEESIAEMRKIAGIK
jgi:hypothetical protein